MVQKCLFWSTFRVKNVHIDVGKDQTISKTNYGFLNSPKNQTNRTILSKEAVNVGTHKKNMESENHVNRGYLVKTGRAKRSQFYNQNF